MSEHTTEIAVLVGESIDLPPDVDQWLRDHGYEVTTVKNGQEAVGLLKSPPGRVALVVTQESLPDTRGLRVIRQAKKRDPEVITCLVHHTPIGDEESGSEDVDQGFVRAEWAAPSSQLLTRLLERRKLAMDSGILGRSPAIRLVLEAVAQIAGTNITVLIQGESGVGKELVARAIHSANRRATYPFVAVNCGALPESLLESELFGHEKGAFTGAEAQRKGRFELAHRGTLLLDEVGEMAPGTQVKLLRVLEEGLFMRVGGTEQVQVDVRVLAASNQDLRTAVDRGTFREDLFFRLNVVPLFVPPLRERPEDIPLLAAHFLAHSAEIHGVRPKHLTSAAMEALQTFDWPGNVRELKNLLDSLVVLSSGHLIDVEDLPSHVRRGAQQRTQLPVRVHQTREEAERELIYRTLLDLKVDLGEIKQLIREAFARRAIPVQARATTWSEAESEAGGTIGDLERELILRTLEEAGGNRKDAARRLGISERTLYRKLKHFQSAPKQPDGS